MKRTLIVGATTNAGRYAYIAAEMLLEYGNEIVPIGIRRGEILGKEILDIRSMPQVRDIDTLTLYIGPDRQAEWVSYLLSLKPKRIIFNPGTENVTFEQKATEQGVEVLQACTLVMLRSGQY